MKKHFFLILGLLVLFSFGCSDDGDNATPNSTNNPNTSNTPSGQLPDWLIPENQVFDGGPGKDGIPSVDNPNFSPQSAINFLGLNDLVVAVNFGNEARAYPHPILDWHEIVNDRIGDISLALTYCPLTGTGIGWDRVIDGDETTFGVSGLLYNTNLLPYDRATDSNWSQMRHECVNGDRRGTVINTYHVVEMSFDTYRKMYPDGLVMNTNTGFNRSYGAYPYGGYRTNEQLIFPISNEDDTFHPKERVLGMVVGEEVKAYPFTNFPGAAITAIEDQIGGEDVVIVGSTELNFMTGFNRQLADGTLLSFDGLQNQFPAVMIDNEGTEWDAFGNAISGPRQGTRLEAPLNYIGYWFAWATFNPEIRVF